MPIGAGKYDAEVTELMDKLRPRSVILVVIDGPKGSGFSAHMTFPDLIRMPEMLEAIAAQLRADRAKAAS